MTSLSYFGLQRLYCICHLHRVTLGNGSNWEMKFLGQDFSDSKLLNSKSYSKDKDVITLEKVYFLKNILLKVRLSMELSFKLGTDNFLFYVGACECFYVVFFSVFTLNGMVQ